MPASAIQLHWIGMLLRRGGAPWGGPKLHQFPNLADSPKDGLWRALRYPALKVRYRRDCVFN
jgi:hypothetical protein